MKALVKGGLLGGVILFIWGIISWMVLPWHMTTLHTFKDEKAVAAVVQVNVPAAGTYVLPSMSQAQAAKEAATPAATAAPVPVIFATVAFERPTSMTYPMIIALIYQIIAAFLVTWMLTKTNLGYWGKVGFVLVFAITVDLITHLPYWNWFHFPTDYTLVAAADLLIGWFLAALVLAKVSQQPARPF